MIHPRSTIGTPTPPADRRRLARVGVLLAHHVGVNVGHRYRSSDPQQVLSDARAIAAFGISSGRPWEYSYLIGLDGSIFEQAGEFMAAHVLDFNPHSAAVAFLNANDVQVNAAQVAAWWEVRDHMVDVGTLSADHVAAPHYRYRTTACPGIRAEPPGKPWQSPTGQGRLGSLIPALTLRPTPTTIPPTTDEVDMIAIDYKPGTPEWTAMTFTGAHLNHIVNGHADQVIRAAGVQRVTVDDNQLDGLIRSSQTTTATPPAWVNTARGAAWTAQRG